MVGPALAQEKEALSLEATPGTCMVSSSVVRHMRHSRNMNAMVRSMLRQNVEYHRKFSCGSPTCTSSLRNVWHSAGPGRSGRGTFRLRIHAIRFTSGPVVAAPARSASGAAHVLEGAEGAWGGGGGRGGGAGASTS